MQRLRAKAYSAGRHGRQTRSLPQLRRSSQSARRRAVGLLPRAAAPSHTAARAATPGHAATCAVTPQDAEPAPTHAGPPADAQPAATTYVGTAACERCHAPSVAFWRATKHARALASLEAAHRAKSPDCVGCHVTGWFQPGGTEALDVATTRLRDVGCEACHGPGSAHAAAPKVSGKIARQVPAQVCLGCHTPDRTQNGFDYAAFLGAVTGPGHGAPPP